MEGVNKKTPADQVHEAEHGTSAVADETASDELPEEDPEHHAGEEVFDIADVNILLANAEFQISLNTVCKAVFRQFGASPRYGEAQDLRQEVLMRFDPWLDKYKGTANLKLVLHLIATNLCIDEVRRQDAQIRALIEINFDDIDLEALRNPVTEDIDARILFAECRSKLSTRERMVFDEYFTEGRTLREIAHSHNLSKQAVVNTLQRILTKLRLLIESGKESDTSFRESGKSTSAGSEGGTNAFPTCQVERLENKLEKMLLKEGLLSEIPPPITDFMSYRKRKPVKVKGKPISETIIEERR